LSSVSATLLFSMLSLVSILLLVVGSVIVAS
jgi:hypothetical protein